MGRHLGSSLDDFLKEQGVTGNATDMAALRVREWRSSQETLVRQVIVEYAEAVSWLAAYDRGEVAPQRPSKEVGHVTVEEVIALHDSVTGNTSPLRDRNLLESAVASALNAMSYAGADTEEAGWTLAASIVRNHPFTDGNKRTALLAMVLFWKRNGVLVPEDQVWLAQKILKYANLKQV